MLDVLIRYTYIHGYSEILKKEKKVIHVKFKHRDKTRAVHTCKFLLGNVCSNCADFKADHFIIICNNICILYLYNELFHRKALKIQ